MVITGRNCGMYQSDSGVICKRLSTSGDQGEIDISPLPEALQHTSSLLHHQFIGTRGKRAALDLVAPFGITGQRWQVAGRAITMRHEDCVRKVGNGLSQFLRDIQPCLRYY